MSLFYSPVIVTDNSLATRNGRNQREVPNQRQQDETLTNYPFGNMQNRYNNKPVYFPMVQRGYAWPNSFAGSSEYFQKARRSLAGEYLHGVYELCRPGATPNWP